MRISRVVFRDRADLPRRSLLAMYLIEAGLNLLPAQISSLMRWRLVEAAADIYVQCDDGRFEGWPPIPMGYRQPKATRAHSS